MHIVCYIHPHVGGYECTVYGIPQILCHGIILRIEFNLLGFEKKGIIEYVIRFHLVY